MNTCEYLQNLLCGFSRWFFLTMWSDIKFALSTFCRISNLSATWCRLIRNSRLIELYYFFSVCSDRLYAKCWASITFCVCGNHHGNRFVKQTVIYGFTKAILKFMKVVISVYLQSYNGILWPIKVSLSIWIQSRRVGKIEHLNGKIMNIWRYLSIAELSWSHCPVWEGGILAKFPEGIFRFICLDFWQVTS